MPNQRRRPIGRKRKHQSVATKALALAQANRRNHTVEYKNHNADMVSDPNSTGITTSICAIASNPDLEDRIGNKIRLKYLKLSGSVSVNASATFTAYRFMVVRDNNGSTTIPNITALFATVAAFVANENKLGDPQRNSRFTILYDKWIYVDVLGPRHVSFKKTLSLDSHCYFSGPLSTDEGKGALYLYQASDEATNDPIVTADFTLKYIDS